MLAVVLILVVPMFAISALAVTACMMSARISMRDDASGYETPLRCGAMRLSSTPQPGVDLPLAK